MPVVLRTTGPGRWRRTQRQALAFWLVLAGSAIAIPVWAEPVQQTATPAAAAAPTDPSPKPAQPQSAPAAGPEQEAAPHGKVLFSRSAAAAASTATVGANEMAPAALASAITDAQRSAPVFTRYDFALHLQPSMASLEAEVRLWVRNDGAVPLGTLPLQLSSTLHFEHVRLDATPLRFAVHTLDTDADHTGSLNEAAVLLPQPLAPGASISLVVDYGGAIPQNTGRLDRLGAPAAIAANTDWDRVGEGFTALRGFGDTVWYPVASVPVRLGEGNRLFREIGRQRAINHSAVVSMAITTEFSGDMPNVALLDGHSVPAITLVAPPSEGFPGIATVQLPPTPLGFDAVSLVLATRALAVQSPTLGVGALPSNVDKAANYQAGVALLEPLFTEWLGAKPVSPLTLIDLPSASALPAQQGDGLLLPLKAGEPPQLAGSLSGALGHAWFHSPQAWLAEGVPGLMRVLWTERTEGRDKALQQLGGQRDALALAEPATPGSFGGEPLPAAQDAVFFRTKATYVLWMLRSIVGDAALAQALEQYRPSADTTPDYFQKLVETAVREQAGPNVPYAGGQSASAVTSAGAQAGTRVGAQDTASTPADSAGNAAASLDPRDLGWFFRNWVLEDPGLPDLAISNVFSSKTGAGDQWLVAVEISNTGYAEAAVPVVVHSPSTSVSVMVRVPARGSLSRRILLLGEPTEVDVNDGTVPEIEASAHQRIIQ
ncbi:hypothetical protein [Acidipila sp. EB88]|uniref:hypothetical protein n=1 Tax=Acidipila sp. EB88 TaxID=2305226 RepID=UPI000F601CB6|nr:hypothetical protein [Acidipila sp. EB88]RRA48591.1 hypothetical protein D1Y84_10125 [Acidipila sp. EB88]